jgi:hypothetical protein
VCLSHCVSSFAIIGPSQLEVAETQWYVLVVSGLCGLHPELESAPSKCSQCTHHTCRGKVDLLGRSVSVSSM